LKKNLPHSSTWSIRNNSPLQLIWLNHMSAI
jgi:hypothetical protein